MEITQIDPHIRFASRLLYDTVYNNSAVRVSDCRLFFVLEGSATLTVGQAQYHLEPQYLFYCCAGSRYRVQTDRELRLITLNFDLTQKHSAQTLPLPPERDCTKWNDMPVLQDPVEGSFLGDHLFLRDASDHLAQLERIVLDFDDPDRFGRALAGSRLKTLLIQLHQTPSDAPPPKVSQVREYILEHYREPLTNAQLARLAGYHEYYLNRIFTAATGQSLHEFLLKVRLNKAGFLILNTDLELQDVGEQVGFGSYPHFSAAFKQFYGLSPAQYRKRLRGSI